MGAAVLQRRARPRPVAMRAPLAKLLLLLLLALALAVVPGEGREAARTAGTSGARRAAASRVRTERPAREAYVSLLYGNAYLLPLRVMMRSLAENSPDVAQGTRERVVLVTGTTAQQTVSTLVDDGITVIHAPTVDTPYANDQRFQNRFLSVMTKLVIFNLTQFDRLVFLDADALVLRDLSDTFRCGKFCAVFINPCHFNSGLMLVSPSTSLFNDMIEKLPSLPSYDGGDQGFLNAYFPNMLSAPMFQPAAVTAAGAKPHDFARLPFTFHLDHSAFYPRFRWDQPKTRCGGEMREQEWLGPSFMKPWLWYTYAILDQSWVWHEYRQKLSNPYPLGARTSVSAYWLIALSYIGTVPLFFLLHSRLPGFTAVSAPSLGSKSLRMRMQTVSARLQYVLFHVLPHACPFSSSHRRYGQLNALMASVAAYALGFAISFAAVPPLLPPYLGTITFIHLRCALNFVLFIIVMGSILCCGQLAARSPHEQTGASLEVYSHESLQKPADALSRIVMECALWAVIDGMYLSTSFFILWHLPFTVLSARVCGFILAVVSHAAVTVCVLVRVTSIWLRWAPGLSPLRWRRTARRRVLRAT